MLLIPAIDIRGSKVVRLKRGDFNQSKVYSDNPLEIALSYEKASISRIHIVDLDAALRGSSLNREIIKDIAVKTSLEIELGGGIRDEAAIKFYLDAGIDYLIVGTRAYQDPKWFKEMLSKYSQQLILGLDLSKDSIKISGWTEEAEFKARDLVSDFRAAGLGRLVYTDISRDGTLEGIDLGPLRSFLDDIYGLELNIIVSGGVKDTEDIADIKAIEDPRIEGLIIGKALYEGEIRLEDLKGGAA